MSGVVEDNLRVLLGIYQPILLLLSCCRERNAGIMLCAVVTTTALCFWLDRRLTLSADLVGLGWACSVWGNKCRRATFSVGSEILLRRLQGAKTGRT